MWGIIRCALRTIEQIAFIQSGIGEDKVWGIKQCADRTVERVASIQ